MGRNIFGWDLPPGCTMNDIERAYGDAPLIDEAFEAQGKLTEEEKKLWASIYDLDEKLFNLMVKAMEWAHNAGYEACQGDNAEAEYYKEASK